MASFVFGNAPAKAFNKEIDWNDGNVKVMLVTAAYVPNKDTHSYKSSVTNEVAGTGYTARGVALASPTITYDAATDKTTLDAADVTWANATITARGAVVYYDTGVDGTSPLIAYQDFGSDKTSTAGDFKIVFDAAGIVTVTA